MHNMYKNNSLNVSGSLATQASSMITASNSESLLELSDQWLAASIKAFEPAPLRVVTTILDLCKIFALSFALPITRFLFFRTG